MLFIKKSKKAITIYSEPLGHIIYNIKHINNINEKVIVICHYKIFDFVHHSITNDNITLFSSSNLSIFKFLSLKVSFILMAPMCFARQFSKYDFILMPWQLSYSYSSITSSFTKLWYAFFLMVAIVCKFAYRISFYKKHPDSNVNNDTLEIYLKYFKLLPFKKQNKYNYVKEPLILINIHGSDNNRVLPFNIVISQINKLDAHSKTNIVFIGVGKHCYEITSSYVKKLSLNHNIFAKNIVNCTNLSEIYELILLSSLVITVETGISHLAYVLHRNCNVYLMKNSAHLSSKHSNWRYDLLWWNWNGKEKSVIINKEFLD